MFSGIWKQLTYLTSWTIFSGGVNLAWTSLILEIWKLIVDIFSLSSGFPWHFPSFGKNIFKAAFMLEINIYLLEFPDVSYMLNEIFISNNILGSSPFALFLKDLFLSLYHLLSPDWICVRGMITLNKTSFTDTT